MFTTSHILIGLAAALIIGLSKTAIPGGGMLATPMLATVVTGRAIAGLMIPLLLVADVFAVRWYGRHAKWDVLRPLVRPVAVGFMAGTSFYVVIGKGGRILDVSLGVMILVLSALQIDRVVRQRPPAKATPALANAAGVTGGFTTFVSNAAGPIMNTYLTGIGLDKETLIGTSAWFYFAVNAAKVPVYLAIGAWSKGGPFFTAESMRFDLAVVAAVFVGVGLGRWMLPRIKQRTFTIVVLVLAGLAAVKLLSGW